MDYDTGFVIAPDTVRFRQRRVEKPMLCHELFYCAEVHATPFLTRTQVQGFTRWRISSRSGKGPAWPFSS